MYQNYLVFSDFRIVSNKEFDFCKKVDNFEEFKKELKNADFGIWIEEDKFKMNEVLIFNNKKELLSYEDIVLNYLNFLNSFLREQIGVCIDKSIPRVIDNNLTYLIIQRKDYKDFDENFFIANKGEIIFPTIKKEYDFKLAILKLADWMKRANKNLIKFEK